jgi:hypothetical protein
VEAAARRLFFASNQQYSQSVIALHKIPSHLLNRNIMLRPPMENYRRNSPSRREEKTAGKPFSFSQKKYFGRPWQNFSELKNAE